MKNLEKKPFALIGVSINPYGAKDLKEAMDKEQLPWRSFVDGGPIGHKWNVHSTPTLYVLDHKGVIRHKWLGSPGAKIMDAALQHLVKEAERVRQLAASALARMRRALGGDGATSARAAGPRQKAHG